MIIKIQNTYIEVDDITIIYPVRKYDGKIFFGIELKTKHTIDVSWVIAKCVDDEETLFSKMELLRRELALIKNQSPSITELGQGISMRKEQVRSAARKASR